MSAQRDAKYTRADTNPGRPVIEQCVLNAGCFYLRDTSKSLIH